MNLKSQLDSHPRNARDVRNETAYIHADHDLMPVRSRMVSHRTAHGYEQKDLICMDCNVRFKAHLWLDEEPDGGL